MDDLYQEMINKHEGWGTNICIYMDDIAIATMVPSLRAHVEAVTDILKVAQENSLFFKLEKCLLHMPSIEYLGLILEQGQTRMDPVKVAGVQDWPVLTRVKEVQLFLGFCNFYGAFIKDFLELVLLLNTLTKKGVKFQWTNKTRWVFDALKKHITDYLVLAHPQLDMPFELEVCDVRLHVRLSVGKTR